MSQDLTKLFKGGFVAQPASEIETSRDPETEFIAVLADFGLDVDYLTPYKIQRVKAKGDRGLERSGWYIFYPDGVAAGSYGDWRQQGLEQTWCSKAAHTMTPTEFLENKRRMEEAKKARMVEEEAARKAAAEQAKDILLESQPADSSHEYLVSKGIKAHGIFQHSGCLVIPAQDETGEVTTIQSIDAKGNKKFLKGGKKSGAYFWIEGGRDTIYLCEGYATGATINEITGCAVVVAFDAGNLIKVAPVIRSKFLATKIVVAADNDQFKPEVGNTGIQCGKEAAGLIGAELVVPQFSDLTSKPTDFNDLACLEGRDRTVEQLTSWSVKSQGKVAIKSAFEFSRVGALEIKEIDWVVHGHLETDSLALAFGEPGCGKSFVAVDIACSVATGKSWHGHEVAQGSVFYIAGEGHNGLARRFKAWEVMHGVSLASAPIYKSHRATQLYDQAAAIQVAEAIRAISDAEGVIPKLIVIDTVARNMGGDENSTQDMNLFIEHIDALLRHPYKCCVALIHHSGKASPGQARGSTALRGALDAEYMVEMDQTTKMISLSNKKMKDGEVPADKRFSIEKVGLGVMGREGEIMGAALKAVDISGLLQQAAESREYLGKNQIKGISALEQIMYARRRDGIESAVTRDEWRDACRDAGISRDRFRDVERSLIEKKKVTINAGGIVSLTYELRFEDERETVLNLADKGVE